MCVCFFLFLFNFVSSCFVLFFFTFSFPVYLFPALHNSLPWLLGGVDNNNNNNNNLTHNLFFLFPIVFSIKAGPPLI